MGSEAPSLTFTPTTALFTPTAAPAEKRVGHAARAMISSTEARSEAVPPMVKMMTGNLHGTRILLGISGGIAAYKTPELVRLLRKQGADVQVVMTRSAAHFVTATSLQAVSGQPVRDDLWDPAAEASMGHIELARWADAILIAPASADCLARLAHGRADDLLGALCLASRAPKLLAPAMNTVMWEAAATRRNLKTLRQDGAIILDPESGEQACGETGPGRMQEPAMLAARVADHLNQARVATVDPGTPGPIRTLLTGRHVVVTAGPTREALDPVRFISNHSSGKQGYAFAEAARDLGARVTLISGPVNLPRPPGISIVDVVSAEEMNEQSRHHAAHCDLFVAVAAVADYRPQQAAAQKIKKSSDGADVMQLELVENPDIVAGIASMQERPSVVVGFAAETENVFAHGSSKLRRKKLDAIVINDVSDASIGFNSDDNAATLLTADAQISLGRQSKYDLARTVIEQICARFEEQLASANPEHLAK